MNRADRAARSSRLSGIGGVGGYAALAGETHYAVSSRRISAANAALAISASSSSANAPGGLAPLGPDASNRALIMMSKDVQARKWQRSVVRLGQISIPKWVPDRSAPTEELGRIRASLPSRRTTKRRKKRGLLDAHGGDKAGALGDQEQEDALLGDDDGDEDEDLNLLDDNA